jgi:tetratricopeptide (TPR) repeat protein
MTINKAAEAEFKIGVELAQRNKHSAALAHYKAAIDLNPSDPRYWISFGVCLSALCHWDQAVIALTRGIDLKPHYAEADARIMLADALCRAGRMRDARRQWTIVSQMEPGYPSDEAPMQEAKRRLAEPLR